MSAAPSCTFADLFFSDTPAWRPAGWLPEWDRLAFVSARPAKDDPTRGAVEALRQCWITPGFVWRLCARFLPPADLDPFWNPWSLVGREDDPDGSIAASRVRVFDGRAGRDAMTRDWAPSKSARANGPWGRARDFMQRTLDFARASSDNAAAAVCKAAIGDSWFHDLAWACDYMILPAARVSYISAWPSLIAAGAPPGGTAIPLWVNKPLRWPVSVLRPDGSAATSWRDCGMRVRPRGPEEFEFEGRRFLLVAGRGG